MNGYVRKLKGYLENGLKLGFNGGNGTLWVEDGSLYVSMDSVKMKVKNILPTKRYNQYIIQGYSSEIRGISFKIGSMAVFEKFKSLPIMLNSKLNSNLKIIIDEGRVYSLVSCDLFGLELACKSYYCNLDDLSLLDGSRIAYKDGLVPTTFSDIYLYLG